MSDFIPIHVDKTAPCKESSPPAPFKPEPIIQPKDSEEPPCEPCEVTDWDELRAIERAKQFPRVIELSYEPCKTTEQLNKEAEAENCKKKVKPPHGAAEIVVDVCAPDIVVEKNDVYRMKEAHIFAAYIFNLVHHKPISRDCYYYAQLTEKLACRGPGPDGYVSEEFIRPPKSTAA